MNECDILRPLAQRVAELSQELSQSERKARFRALNALKCVRPVVLVDELPWNQLNVDGSLTLQCETPVLRQVEDYLRKTLFQWRHFQCDMIVAPYYSLPKRISVPDAFPDIQEEILSIDKGNNIVSHRYIDQFRDEDSLDRICVPEISVDEETSAREYDIVSSAIGDILPVRQRLVTAGYYMPWDRLSMLRGVEPILYDLIDRPEFMLRLVEKYTECRLQLLDTLEQRGLIDPLEPIYLHCTAGLCDELPGDISGGVTRANIWGRGNAQMFGSVSPEMHDEFEIEFARRYFKGFARVYYGCCEPLHDKLDILRKIPNLKKISITPWADVDAAADQMGGNYVMAWKPNPALLCTPQLNEDAVRQEVGRALAACRRNNTPMEITLKDISSVSYNLDNLHRWVEIVMDMVD